MVMMRIMINMRVMIVSTGMIENYDCADDEEGGCHLGPMSTKQEGRRRTRIRNFTKCLASIYLLKLIISENHDRTQCQDELRNSSGKTQN